MEWWHALILGIVEGLTEYLPVSSTGHLLLAQRIMGIDKNEAADAYAIVIQAGAILAVLGLYRHRMAQMTRGVLGKDGNGLRLAINIAVAFVVTAVIAVLLEHKVKEHLFGLPAITLAWLVGGLAILAVTYFKPRRKGGAGVTTLDTLGLGQAALIGLIQCLAIWPGTSRSLVTIVAGLLVGMSISAAVEFSFLLGVVTLLAATAKDLKDSHQALTQSYSVGVMLLGVVVAAVSAAIAVQWMVSYLRKHDLSIFGWYRVILAAAVGAALGMGWLSVH